MTIYFHCFMIKVEEKDRNSETKTKKDHKVKFQINIRKKITPFCFYKMNNLKNEIMKMNDVEVLHELIRIFIIYWLYDLK
jgi:hypothetical protein